MSSVETYYLIDFENVNDDGLSGSNTLGPNDHVHLFYTENAKKLIYRAIISKYGQAQGLNIYNHIKKSL